MRVENSLRATVAPGPTRVALHLDENLLAHVKVSLEGETLVVGSADGRDLDPSAGAMISISAPALMEVISAESAEVVATLDASTPRLTSADASRLTATVTSASSVRVVASGSSRVVLEGAAPDQELQAGESSAIESRVDSQTADVEASGTSRISLRVSSSLRALATDASEVTVAGQPAVRDVNTSEDARVVFTP